MTKNRKNVLRVFAAVTFAAAGAAGLWAWDAVAQTGPVPGPFTDAQAEAGKAVYEGKCAVCHESGGETVRLVSAGFTDAWKTRNTRDLYSRIKTTMPLSNPGSLSDAETAQVVAYILKGNGAKPGTTDFTPATSVAINTILDERLVRIIIPKLKQAGAQGLVEYPLNKIVM